MVTIRNVQSAKRTSNQPSSFGTLRFVVTFGTFFLTLFLIKLLFLQLHDLPSHEMKCPYESCATSFTRFVVDIYSLCFFTSQFLSDDLHDMWLIFFFFVFLYFPISIWWFVYQFRSKIVNFQEQQHVPPFESRPRRWQSLHMCVQELLRQVIKVTHCYIQKK